MRRLSSVTYHHKARPGTGNTNRNPEEGRHFYNDQAWVNPEIGYNIVFGDHDAHSWKFGLAMGWQETEKLELMGEVGAFVSDPPAAAFAAVTTARPSSSACSVSNSPGAQCPKEARKAAQKAMKAQLYKDACLTALFPADQQAFWQTADPRC